MTKRNHSQVNSCSETTFSIFDDISSKRPCFSIYENDQKFDVISQSLSSFHFQTIPRSEFRLLCLSVYCPGILGCRKISEYKILSKISEGTFGMVYKAADKQSGKIYAVKKIKEDSKNELSMDVLREIYSMRKCGKHENMINLREVVTQDSKPHIFLVLDYMDFDLRQIIDRLKLKNLKFPYAHVKYLLFQLLNGINFLHGEFIFHRDLKPSNLLLNRQGILKIGDFGLAREYDDPPKNYTPLVVTLWYRAPEILLGMKNYSISIDIWSIGCIFSELLTLEPIFSGANELSQVKKIFEKLGTPSEKLWPGYTKLPNVKYLNFPYFIGSLKESFSRKFVSSYGFEFLKQFLEYDPETRISTEMALTNIWFCGDPWPSSCEKLAKFLKEAICNK